MKEVLSRFYTHLKRIYPGVIILPALAILILSCSDNKGGGVKGARTIADGEGRIINLPDTIRSAVALRSGALRLMCYMDLAGKISHIEENERRRTTPYIIANPELRKLPVIGNGNNHDPELLAASGFDVIITTFMSAAEAEKLQRRTGKPVFILRYGNLAGHSDDLFASLKLLGEIFYRQARADSIIQYIGSTIEELGKRVQQSVNNQLTAYIGGVAYNGAHGITSTLRLYPPFSFLSLSNPASSIDQDKKGSSQSHSNMYIDPEQLIKWNPDFIFLDASGQAVWKEDLERSALRNTLKAVSGGNVYTVLPYNWYSINYENILCNSWFIGSTVFPRSFSDKEYEDKCREIYRFFLGKDVFDEIRMIYKPYEVYGR